MLGDLLFDLVYRESSSQIRVSFSFKQCTNIFEILLLDRLDCTAHISLRLDELAESRPEIMKPIE